MTVTDTKTNQYWTGSANAGPEDLTSYILHIAYGGNVVDNQTQDVCVGEYVQLAAQYGPSDMDLKWTVQGSIIANYTVTNSGPKYSDIDHTKPSTAKITPVTASELAQPLLAYYWMDTDSGKEEDEKVTLAGTMPSGKSPPPAITTFDVDRPAYTFFASYPNGSPISLASGAVYNGVPPGGNGEPGIQFDFFLNNSYLGGDLTDVQIVTVATVTTEQFDATTNETTTFEYTLPSSALAGPLLDTAFPYDPSKGTESAPDDNDSPWYPVDPPFAGSGFGSGSWQTRNVIVSEAFDHELLWTPPDAYATYAPLGQISWGWTFDAENPNNSGFNLASAARVPPDAPSSADLSKLPEWNNNALPSWADPQWSIIQSASP